MTLTHERTEDRVDDLPPIEAGPEESPETPDELPRVTLIRPVWMVAALAVAQIVIALDVNLPVVRPLVALFTLLGVPTLMLYRKLPFPADSNAARAFYAFGSSLLGVIVIGLLLNTVLPVVGIDHPLQPVVLAITWFAVDTALLLWRAEPVAVPEPATVVRRALEARVEVTQALGVVAVLLSIVGAVRLNNGAGGGVALLAQLVAAASLATLMFRREGTIGRDIRGLALIATSLLLATSLRGWGITGHDIQAEYFSFKLTNADQHWSMHILQNAYNACLSVNILPTVIAQTTGLSGVTVFKVLLQLVFALVPVLTYLLSRRYLPRRLALAAAVFTMAFPTFFTDMPYLVRQEVAFFFLALLLLAATEPDQPARRLRWMVGVFGVGVVLSHYSTTYVMIIGLVLGLVVLLVWRLLSLRFGGIDNGHGPLVLLSPVVVVFLAFASLVWAGPATHTGGHAGEVAKETIAAIFGKGTNTPGSSDLSYRLFSHDKVTPRQRLDLFVHQTLEARKQAEPRILVVRHPGKAELRPEIIPARKVPLTGAGKAVDHLGVDPGKLSSAARLGCAALLQIFLALGVVQMISSTRRKGARRAGVEVPRELAAIVLGAVGALGLIVLIPSLSVEYGVLRAFQQTLWVVAPVMAAGLWTLLRPFAGRAATLAVVVPVGLLLVLAGALPTLLGGNPARLALENSGVYYDRYVAPDADVSAMAWLGSAKDTGPAQPDVIANRNDGIRIMSSAPKATQVSDRMYPTMLTRGSYVFVDSHLGRKREGSVFYSGDLITYRYPMQDLDRRLDLVYSAGHNRVYR